eukprot:222986-Chlamydomonas_euryale.AAC.1
MCGLSGPHRICSGATAQVSPSTQTEVPQARPRRERPPAPSASLSQAPPSPERPLTGGTASTLPPTLDGFHTRWHHQGPMDRAGAAPPHPPWICVGGWPPHSLTEHMIVAEHTPHVAAEAARHEN